MKSEKSNLKQYSSLPSLSVSAALQRSLLMPFNKETGHQEGLHARVAPRGITWPIEKHHSTLGAATWRAWRRPPDCLQGNTRRRQFFFSSRNRHHWGFCTISFEGQHNIARTIEDLSNIKKVWILFSCFSLIHLFVESNLFSNFKLFVVLFFHDLL